ncbi:hypothetical protein RHS04_00139 [Rhizoctonia solani]|uniref:F-box domain-containing protein n=2 Tax=Rhizoctonia solani TaxID=456999 RepID=A0A8H7LLJ1_9AGAM|nr:hypothetical protein RHS04_00139 [Rhizoctonia solani]
MPPRTRSAARTTSVTTRASLGRIQSAQKPQAKHAPKPKPVTRASPKVTVQVEQKKKNGPARKRARYSGPECDPKGNQAPDIRLLIARYVHPLDLIMLSRVNKFLRELFMDKRSALIWRSARENHLGLPTCPDEVSEPQYAAMLFTKRCSTCGGYAPREMNPILLIRLCGNCWLEELVDVNRVTDSSLLSVIGGPIPGQSYKWRSWCLYSEAREVKAKLNELNKAGDDEALRKWRSERHSLVEAKRRSAEPLSTWLRNRDRERAKNRDSLKALRQNEIESRLIEIGWEKGDLVCYDGWRRKQWKSMVHTTKRVTDKGKLLVAFPRASEVYTWPECTPLIENDMPHEQFLNEFEAKKTGLQQLIGEWRHRLETQLIAALPKGTLRPTLESSPFTMTIHTTEIVQPVDVLPGDIRKLLRADAIFTTSHIHDHSQVFPTLLTCMSKQWGRLSDAEGVPRQQLLTMTGWTWFAIIWNQSDCGRLTLGNVKSGLPRTLYTSAHTTLMQITRPVHLYGYQPKMIFPLNPLSFLGAGPSVCRVKESVLAPESLPKLSWNMYAMCT